MILLRISLAGRLYVRRLEIVLVSLSNVGAFVDDIVGLDLRRLFMVDLVTVSVVSLTFVDAVVGGFLYLREG